MGFYDVVREAASRSGLPLAQVSLRMGKADSYVNAAISRGSLPRIDTAAAMLSACGWSLCAVPSDEVPPSALVIAPPAPPEDAARIAMERERAALERRIAAIDERLDGGLIG